MATPLCGNDDLRSLSFSLCGLWLSLTTGGVLFGGVATRSRGHCRCLPSPCCHRLCGHVTKAVGWRKEGAACGVSYLRKCKDTHTLPRVTRPAGVPQPSRAWQDVPPLHSPVPVSAGAPEEAGIGCWGRGQQNGLLPSHMSHLSPLPPHSVSSPLPPLGTRCGRAVLGV